MASITNITMLKAFTMPMIIRQTSIGIGTSKGRVIVVVVAWVLTFFFPKIIHLYYFWDLWRFQNFYPDYLSLLIFFSILLMSFFKLPLCPFKL